MIYNIFECAINGFPEPDFINEEGTKWWLLKSSYERFKEARIKKVGYYIETKDKEKLYIIVNKKGVEHESQQLEGQCCMIDAIIRLSKNE